MKNFLVNFQINKEFVQASVVTNTSLGFSTLLNISKRNNNFTDLVCLIDEIKLFINKNVNTKKSKIKYSLIIQDALFNVQVLYNSHSQKLNEIVENDHKIVFEDYLTTSRNNPDYYTLNYAPYMFEVLNNNESKKYAFFPANKLGQKLITYYSLVLIKRSDANFTNVLNLFNSKNIELSQIILESQSLIISQNKKTHSVLVQMNLNTISITGFFNSIVLYNENKLLNFNEVFNKIGRSLNMSKDMASAYFKAVIANWKYYSTIQDIASTESIIFGVCEKMLRKIVDEIEKQHQIHYNKEQYVEYVVSGSQGDLLKHLMAKEKQYNVSTYEQIPVEQNILPASHYGACLMIDEKINTNLIETLNDIDDFKQNKNVFQKFISLFKNV
ncbi:MAG3720 family protein [Mycoplasma zalophidermidis]|uniref:MAG3720 family protein n=1 Tax=Mycoplasma zalophidermidis TaxID=398174 RepID=UPI001C119ABB|nr:hypothetical protein [Mycoplasma zalophidermidis]MBU4689711.1 hypothetical protein [Mycoplasma zalophidermidis]MCR8966657.1 hypothetical protein [Mycoplasma zalophidermidis]